MESFIIQSQNNERQLLVDIINSRDQYLLQLTKLIKARQVNIEDTIDITTSDDTIAPTLPINGMNSSVTPTAHCHFAISPSLRSM